MSPPAEYASVGDGCSPAQQRVGMAQNPALRRSAVMSISATLRSEVPNFVIFLTVLVLASCIITADFPEPARRNIYGYLGVRGKNSVRLMGHSFRAAVFWLLPLPADLCAAGYGHHPRRVLHHRRSLSALPTSALVLAFLDFTPFFGAGTVLVPWGLICMAIGLFDMGWKLLLLYGILYIIRRIFEPRILGSATGFSSLQMLFSILRGHAHRGRDRSGCRSDR